MRLIMKFMLKLNSPIHGRLIPSWCWSGMKADALHLGRIADSTGSNMKLVKDTSDFSSSPKGLKWVKSVLI